MGERKGIGRYNACIDRKPDRVRFRDVPCSLLVGVSFFRIRRTGRAALF